MTRRSALIAVTAMPIAKELLAAPNQGGRQRVSPHESVSIDLGGNTISITYGRPYLKGRDFGKEVAPFGKVWRLGADEATKLTVGRSVQIEGGPQLAAGSYSLWAIPGPQKWTVIVNKNADTWGTRYDQSQDLARFDLSAQKTPSPVEEFTITLTKESSNSAKLTFAWGSESVSTHLKAT